MRLFIVCLKGGWNVIRKGRRRRKRRRRNLISFKSKFRNHVNSKFQILNLRIKKKKKKKKKRIPITIISNH